VAGAKAEYATRMAHRAAMLELLQHPSWDAYSKDLEDAEARALQNLVTGSKDEHDYYKGFITALRWCHAWPQRVIEAAEKEAAKRG